MKQSNGYIIGFAVVTCVICSLLLSGAAEALRERQDQNKVLDRQRNILKAVGFAEEVSTADDAKVASLYQSNIEELVVDRSGMIDSSKGMSSMSAGVLKGEKLDLNVGLPLYKKVNAKGETQAYAYPVVGKGLWGSLYGFLAVKPDGDEIVGISFYKHKETPGLGANIEAEWFTNNFIGKRLHKDGMLQGVEVVKGKVADKTAAAELKDYYMVDGMSGATITGNGVTKMTKVAPQRYEKFFKAQKGGA